jgi:hypothetical protein
LKATAIGEDSWSWKDVGPLSDIPRTRGRRAKQIRMVLIVLRGIKEENSQI